MVEVVLTAMIYLHSGQVIPGALVSGWAPRVQPSMAVCLERKAFAESIPLPAGIKAITFTCEVRRK